MLISADCTTGVAVAVTNAVGVGVVVLLGGMVSMGLVVAAASVAAKAVGVADAGDTICNVGLLAMSFVCAAQAHVHTKRHNTTTHLAKRMAAFLIIRFDCIKSPHFGVFFILSRFATKYNRLQPQICIKCGMP